MRTSKSPTPKSKRNLKRKDIVPIETARYVTNKIINLLQDSEMYWKKSVDHYLKVSTEIHNLKLMKDKILFKTVREELVETKKIMTDSTFYKLERIGRKQKIFNKYQGQLPKSYHSLHLLSQKEDDELEELFKLKKITSDSTIENIGNIKDDDSFEIPNTVPNKPKKNKTSNDHESSIVISFRPSTITGNTNSIKDIVEQLDKVFKLQKLGAKIIYKGQLKRKIKDEL